MLRDVRIAQRRRECGRPIGVGLLFSVGPGGSTICHRGFTLAAGRRAPGFSALPMWWTRRRRLVAAGPSALAWDRRCSTIALHREAIWLSVRRGSRWHRRTQTRSHMTGRWQSSWADLRAGHIHRLGRGAFIQVLTYSSTETCEFGVLTPNAPPARIPRLRPEYSLACSSKLFPVTHEVPLKIVAMSKRHGVRNSQIVHQPSDGFQRVGLRWP